MKKKGCLRILAVIAALFVAFKVWTAYSNRPVGLYKRWIDDTVPEDVSELDGYYRFALTESTAWLSFKTTETRIAEIVKAKGMHEVIPESPWNDGNNSRRYSINGKNQGGNWFDIGGLRHFKPVPPDLKVYWRSHDGSNESYSGWALYFSKSTGEAYWTSISI